MKSFARVADGLVAEIIDIPADGPPVEDRFHPDLLASLVEVKGAAPAVGDGWDGKRFRAAPPPPPAAPVVPASISRRQLLLAMAGAGLITGPEALAAATTGAVPAAIDAVFARLPAAEALAARITWATMSVAEREHPLIGALVAANLATVAQVDALFIAGAAL
jgi:hypothetical protein